MQLEKVLEGIEELRGQVGSECTSEDHYIKKAWEHCLDRVVSIISKHMNDGWIPVDKNNTPDHEILACDRYDNELIGYLGYNADTEEFVCESDECIMYQVIAWMEKPEPYRPEGSEE